MRHQAAWLDHHQPQGAHQQCALLQRAQQPKEGCLQEPLDKEVLQLVKLKCGPVRSSSVCFKADCTVQQMQHLLQSSLAALLRVSKTWLSISLYS